MTIIFFTTYFVLYEEYNSQIINFIKTSQHLYVYYIYTNVLSQLNKI